MRAVNLIPSDSAREGAGGGIGAYALLAVLGVLVAGVIAYVLTNNALVERRAELDSLQTQVRAAQAQAEATRPYREFAALAEARVRTVRELGAARFDWHRAFRELSRVIPDNVWLTELLGTVTTGVSVEGSGSGTTSTLRSAMPNPAIEIVGCTTRHEHVARFISRLRLMTGVVRVSLADSEKLDAAGSSSGAGEAPRPDGSDCRYGNVRYPRFGLVVFFDQLPAVEPPSDVGAATAQPAVSTGDGATTTPAATGSATGSDMR